MSDELWRPMVFDLSHRIDAIIKWAEENLDEPERSLVIKLARSEWKPKKES